MRCVVQRSGPASVRIAAESVGSIEKGLVVLAAFGPLDTSVELTWMARKLPRLRIFNDTAGKMNLSLREVGGGILLVSQFTLYGNCLKGMRPSSLTAVLTAAQPAFFGVQVQNGEVKLIASTSIPCSSISFAASVLSNPPEISPIARIFFFSITKAHAVA